MSERFICIHGHFYQPPRENPWLESIELQDSAAPYHDWNERITAECYAPNTAARLLDGEGRIRSIVSNYSRISFNFGPTLLAWLRERVPDVHDAIVRADQLSRERFDGHGSALAQVYNHMILPLANTRDKQTQVRWGIRDFQHRFGRAPEGLWLPETAADTETLDVLARHGIKFTVLSPFQAARARELGKRAWRDVNGGQIDPTRPYVVRLPEGRSIAVFFYDAPVSQAVAFEKLLGSGERLANRLLSAFVDRRQRDQLVNIATDGESYGHHHKHGEMALAYALEHIEDQHLAKLTNYSQFLATHPPTHEARIHEKASWSCVHGVGRWMADCGCNSGGHGGWNQGWRGPLREALDWLRDELAQVFEEKARPLLADPWAARDDYLAIILDRTAENRDRFLAQHGTRALGEEEKVQCFKLLELQRHAMLMYTSCGWFFDELSGIETVQVVQYAGRALQLATELLGPRHLEAEFLKRLEHAKGNIPEHANGRVIYEKFVRPARIDRPKAVAHYAVSSLFHDYPDCTRIFSFTFEDQDRHNFAAGKTRLAIGQAKVTSEITQECDTLAYAILYMGEHNLTGGVRPFESPEAYGQMLEDIKGVFERADFPETIRLIDRHFGEASYSLKSLFKDEQRRILNDILASTRDDLESRFRLIAERYTPLMRFLEGAGAPLPPALETATDFVLHGDIRQELRAPTLNLQRLRQLIGDAIPRGGRVLDAEISFEVAQRLERLFRELENDPGQRDKIREIIGLADVMMPLQLGLNLARIQNRYWQMLDQVVPRYRDQAGAGSAEAREWLECFRTLGEKLRFAHGLLEHLVQPAQIAA